MRAITFQLPDSLHGRVEEMSRRDGVPVDQFISTAVAEKLSALYTVDYLRRRGAQSSQEALSAPSTRFPTWNQRNTIGCESVDLAMRRPAPG